MSKRIDLTGMKFNRLTVESYEYTRNGCAYWMCRCDCGSNVILNTQRIKSGHTKSCGCLNKEAITKLGRGVGQVKYPKMNSSDWKTYSRYIIQKKHNFNVSEDGIRSMMDHQKGCCLICGESLDHINGDTFHIDHNTYRKQDESCHDLFEYIFRNIIS